jgi:DNA recombination-dependent growth factor C
MFPVGREDYLDRIRLHRFRELIVDSDDDVSVGWVPIRNMLGEFTTPTIIFEQQYVVMALRIDKWSIPSALFKAMLNEEIEDTKREEKREHLTKLEKSEIKARLRRTLKNQSLPSCTVIDIVWDTNSNNVWFASTSKGNNELFIDLFERTFSGLEVKAESPAFLWMQVAKMNIEQVVQAAKGIEITCFVGNDDEQ